MPDSELIAYPPDAVTGDATGFDFVLGRTYIHARDGIRIVVRSAPGGGAPVAAAFRRDGSTLAIGQLVEVAFGKLTAPEGLAITLFRIDVAGLPVGYRTSRPLDPEATYRGRATPFGDHGGQLVLAAPDPATTPGVSAATIIVTEAGDVPVAWLRAGDLVLTRDHGYQALLAVVAFAAGTGRSADRAVLKIPVDGFGPGLPAQVLLVTGGQGILLRDPQLDLCFGEPEMLIFAADRCPASSGTDRRKRADFIS